MLWLLLALSVALFWIPLRDADDIAADRVSGSQLLAALPPLTVGAGVLLIAVQCAALTLVRSRPLLLTASLPALFGALHGAPPLLGVRPEAASGPWHRPAADVLAQLTHREMALEILPVLLQLLCLGLAALALRAAGADGRAVAAVVWVLAMAGWSAQSTFAALAVPVSLGLLAVAIGTILVRIAAKRARYRG